MSSVTQELPEQKKNNKKPEVYNKYNGGTTHLKISEELGISVSLSHHIESKIFLKFALAVFQPPWQVRNKTLARLKDANGDLLQFSETGEYFEILSEMVYHDLGSNVDQLTFKKECEKRIVEISKHVEFRKFVFSLLRGEDDDEEEALDKAEEKEEIMLNMAVQKS